MDHQWLSKEIATVSSMTVHPVQIDRLMDVGQMDIDDECIVISGPIGLSPGKNLVDVAHELRNHWLFWGPIHLLVPSPPRERSEGDKRSAIFFHRLPPQDVGILLHQIERSAPVAIDHRAIIVTADCNEIADEIGDLIRTFGDKPASTIRSVRECLGWVIECLQVLTDASVPLGEKAQAYMNASSLSVGDLRGLSYVLQEAWVISMRTICVSPEDIERAERLKRAIHSAQNAVGLAQALPEETLEQSARRLEARLLPVLKRGPAYFYNRKDIGVLTELQTVLRELRRPTTLTNIIDPMRQGIQILRRVSRPTLQSLGQQVALTEILVIEDDPEWQAIILEILREMDLGLPVMAASDLETARRLLKAVSPGAAILALVDLGLPVTPDDPVVLDAGLTLIQEFTGTRSRHRFVVLTAARDNATTIRSAYKRGILPSWYVLKDPATWQNRLRIVVRLALQPPPPPLLEVFSSSECVVRMDGHEITLDRNAWCLLDLFSAKRGGWLSPQSIVQNLALYHQIYLEDDDPYVERKRVSDNLSRLREVLTNTYRRAHGYAPPILIHHDQHRGYRMNVTLHTVDGGIEEYAQERRRPPVVLVVEDNSEWGSTIVETLENSGFRTMWARDVHSAHELLEHDTIDLVSLDMQLPGDVDELHSGITDSRRAVTFLHELRQKWPGLPVAVLTSQDSDETNMLTLLTSGIRIDDFISKHDPNWASRLTSSLLRLRLEWWDRINIFWDLHAKPHPITIDSNTGLLCKVADYPISVSANSNTTKILRELSARPNTFVSRSHLKSIVWPEDAEKFPDDPANALDRLLSRLRRIITVATKHQIPGEEVIPKGLLCLRGVVQ